MRGCVQWAALTVALCLASCGSVDVHAQAVRFKAGDIEGLRGELIDLADSGGDAHLWLMQRSVVDLAAGDARAAIAALRTARDRLDALRAAAYGHWIEAAFFDDRMFAYDGADYEHVLVRTQLALQDLVARAGDVIPYLNQMLARQVELRTTFVTETGEKPKLRYKSAAIGNWLLAAVEAENPTRADLVQRQLKAVLELEPRCQIARRELARYEREGFAPAGHGVVQVVALVGLGPYRVARAEPVSSAILHAAQVIYNKYKGRATFSVNEARKVQVPALAFHRDNPSEALVQVGSKSESTELVTSVEAIATAEFAAMRTQIVTRAVLRRIFKLVLNEVAKEALEKKAKENETERQRLARQRDNQGIALLGDVFTAVSIAAEAADLRCWSLLPASFQVARMVLPEGDHDVVIRAGKRGLAAGPAQTVRVHVRAGRSTFVVAQLPGLGIAPPPQTSDPAR